MRLKHLNLDDCQQLYTAEKKRVEEFVFRRQDSWYFHANGLVRLAKIAYAMGNPLLECRSWLRQATDAYRELFALRGTTFSKHTKFEDGKPLPEETIQEDGYTSVDSFNAALAALAIQEVALGRELVELAGPSPNAQLVSPRSEVCTTNEQTLSHALNALLASDLDLASHEAGKLAVRRATQFEKQIALTISAIATDGDVVAELDALLFFHEKLALRRDNISDPTYWFCLPALGLASLSVHRGQIARTDLTEDNVYFPVELLFLSDAIVE